MVWWDRNSGEVVRDIDILTWYLMVNALPFLVLLQGLILTWLYIFWEQ